MTTVTGKRELGQRALGVGVRLFGSIVEEYFRPGEE